MYNPRFSAVTRGGFALGKAGLPVHRAGRGQRQPAAGSAAPRSTGAHGRRAQLRKAWRSRGLSTAPAERGAGTALAGASPEQRHLQEQHGSFEQRSRHSMRFIQVFSLCKYTSAEYECILHCLKVKTIWCLCSPNQLDLSNL